MTEEHPKVTIEQPKIYVTTIEDITAWSHDGSVKPRRDLSNIPDFPVEVLPIPMFGVNAKLENLPQMLRPLRVGDVLINQYPLYDEREYVLEMNRLLTLKGVKNVAWIHDIDKLRGLSDKVDTEILNTYDAYILPSLAMADYLEAQGVHVYGPDNAKLKGVINEMWDYLLDKPVESSLIPYKDRVLVYAGNLTQSKSSFLDNFPDINLNVYGANVDNRELTHDLVTYKGDFSPEEIPHEIRHGIGLVIDGDEDSAYRSYNAYNTPYKLSMYLSAGIPVIALEGSVAGDIIKKQGLGATIKELSESELRTAITYISNRQTNIRRKTKEYQKIVTQGINTRKSIMQVVPDYF